MNTLLFLPLLCHAEIVIEELQRAELPPALLSGYRTKIVLTGNNQLTNRTTAEMLSGQVISGHYRLKSDSDRPITINLKSNKDDKYIGLRKFSLVYKGRTYKNFPVTNLSSPGAGADIFIGFTAIVRSRAKEGERFPSYTIDVFEE